MASSSIIAKIGLNSAGFKTGLAKCRAMAKGFKTSVGGMFSGIGGQVLGALGLSAGVAGISALTQKTIEFGGHVEDMANQLRIGKSEFQVIAYTAKLAGMEESRLVMTMNNLNLRTIEACDGNQTYRDALNRLGIDLQKFAQLSPDKKLEMLGNAYKKSGESLTALNDISTILGQKTGPQMLEVLDRISSEGMENLTQSAKDAGRVMDEETLAALARAGDEIDSWQNKIIVAFGGFLADMGSSIGRQKWGYMIGLKFAQAGQYIEEALRNIGNYILATFSTIFRYLSGKFADFVMPIRSIYFALVKSFYTGMANIIGLFSDSMEDAINKAICGLELVDKKTKELTKKDNKKDFVDIFGEEISNAQQKNSSRKESDLWSSSSVDWWKKEIEQAEKLRKIEKDRHLEEEKARKEKYKKADRNVEIKETAKDKADKKKDKKSNTYNDSYLAKIGGGGLTAARYDVSEKQLSETKKQSKILKQIAENTEPTKNKTELLMK